MSKIKIHRNSEYSNRFRNIDIYLDNKILGKIKDGESIDFEIPNGKHSLTAKIDWTTSNEVEFDIENETVQFNLSGTSPFLALYYITFGRKNYLKLKICK
jgi:hypothetical protein